MKKITGLFVLCALVLGLGVPAFASGYSTSVSYVGTASEEIVITVPASLTAGGASGQVTVSGAWPSYKTVFVTAPAAVELTNSMTGARKSADISFPGLAVSGSDEHHVSAAETISVSAPGNTIFGAWTGTFNYAVSVGTDVAQGATTANTSWKFHENLSGYETLFGTFDYDAQTGWEPFPETSTIGNETLSYHFWGFSITNLEGVPIFGPVQSVSEPYVFGYTPMEVLGVQPGWYLIDGEMLTAWLDGTPYGAENVTVDAAYIVANGLECTSAPTITIGEVNRADYPDGAEGDAEYQQVVDALENSDVIAWLRESAEVQAYVPPVQ